MEIDKTAIIIILMSILLIVNASLHFAGSCWFI